MGTRTLTVCACYMDGLELTMRMTEVLVQGMGVAQSFLVSTRSRLLKDRCDVEQVFNRFLVGHHQLK